MTERTEDGSFEHGEVVSSLLDLQRRLRAAQGTPPAPEPTAVEAPPRTPAVDRPEPTIVATADPGAGLDAPVAVRTLEAPPAEADDVEVSASDVSVRMSPETEQGPGRVDEVPGAEAPPLPPTPVERFAPVTQLPTTAASDDRISALARRLEHLQEDLSGVLGSIESVRTDVGTALIADIDERMETMRTDADARIARLLAERTAAVSNRVSVELDAQRRELSGLLERQIAAMQDAMRGEIAHLLDRRIEAMEDALRAAIRDAVTSVPTDGRDTPPTG